MAIAGADRDKSSNDGGALASDQMATIRKVAWRLLPFLGLCYFTAFLDRINVGMAALTMNKALGLSATAFGAGAGIFFIGYFVFELPSNMILMKVGARRWIARIAISWGLITVCTAFIRGEWSFLVVRFLLGVAEAGFFPGMLYFLTLWFPAAWRGRATGFFMASASLSSIVGPLVSGYLLQMTGIAGFAGWQWLFIIEGLAAVIVGLFCLRILIERPADAGWLTPAERRGLESALASERQQRAAAGGHTIGAALASPRVWLLSLASFGQIFGLYSMAFWQPLILKGFGDSTLTIAYISSSIALIGVVGMVLWPRHSDRTGERTWHFVAPVLLACCGFILAALSLHNQSLMLLGLCLAGLGIAAGVPIFWTFPTEFLTGAGAAGGFAVINSIGNLAGYFGPQMMGIMRDATGSFEGALLLVAVGPFITACIGLILGTTRRRQEAVA
jgi:MFS transporter, ACS family, tartrate transporter